MESKDNKLFTVVRVSNINGGRTAKKVSIIEGIEVVYPLTFEVWVDDVPLPDDNKDYPAHYFEDVNFAANLQLDPLKPLEPTKRTLLYLGESEKS
jgi:hypothetical protein